MYHVKPEAAILSMAGWWAVWSCDSRQTLHWDGCFDLGDFFSGGDCQLVLPAVFKYLLSFRWVMDLYVSLRYKWWTAHSGRGRYWANAAGTELHSQPWFVSSAGCFRHYVFFLHWLCLTLFSTIWFWRKQKQAVLIVAAHWIIAFKLQVEIHHFAACRSCSTLHLFLFFKSDPNWEAADWWKTCAMACPDILRYPEALCTEIWSWKISCALLEIAPFWKTQYCWLIISYGC